MSGNYFAPTGGHPGQTEVMTDRAVFKTAYAVIPKGVMRDIVTSVFSTLGRYPGLDYCAAFVWLC